MKNEQLVALLKKAALHIEGSEFELWVASGYTVPYAEFRNEEASELILNLLQAANILKEEE